MDNHQTGARAFWLRPLAPKAPSFATQRAWARFCACAAQAQAQAQLGLTPPPALAPSRRPSAELAEQLAAEGCLVVAAAPTTAALLGALEVAHATRLKPYARGDMSGIVRAIDALAGVAPG
jgi:hypothetical protein